MKMENQKDNQSDQEGKNKDIKIVQTIKEREKKEIEKVKKEKSEEKLKNSIQKEIKKNKNEILEGIKTRDQEKIDKSAQELAISIIRATEIAKEGVSVSNTKEGQVILSNLGEKDLSLEAYSSISVNLSDFLIGEEPINFSTDNNLTNFERALAFLKRDSHDGFLAITTALKKACREGKINISEEDIDKKILYLTDKNAKDIVKERQEAEFDRFWSELSGRYYEPGDKKLMRAIFIPEEFVSYIKEIKDEIRDKYKVLDNEDELNKKVSEIINRDITFLFSKLTAKLDVANPKKLFEEITSEDFMRGISITKNSLDFAVYQLQRYFEANRVNYDDVNSSDHMDFFITGTEEKVEERDMNGHVKIVRRLKATHKPIKSNLSDFIQFCLISGNHEYDAREYTHNARAVYYFPPASPDEGGFYGRLTNLAERFNSTETDEIYNLPDGDVVKAAFGLYHKYLTEEFAVNSWINTPDMFQPERGDVRTKTENDVLRSLSKLYPEMKDKDAWRLRRALSLAMGISRGIHLNEPELAAFADPAIDQKGGKIFRSYYTNDPGALTVLNPAHFHWRWQSEDTKVGTLIFTPILGPIPKDHKELLKQSKRYEDSYLNGTLEKKDPDELLLIDLFLNIGNVGSMKSRGGWRDISFYEGWLVNPEGNDLITKNNMLDNWKIIENIGFDVLYDMVSNQIKDNFLKEEININKGNIELSNQKRDLFFEYIVGKYILSPDEKNDQGSPKTPKEKLDELINDYRKNISTKNIKAFLYKDAKKEYKGVEALVNDLVRKGDIDIDGKIEADVIDENGKKENKEELSLNQSRNINKENEINVIVYKKILRRVLAGVAAQRFPTKLLCLERDRLSVDGTRIWQKIREDLEDDKNIDNKRWSGDEGLELYDKTVKNLGLIEVYLRREMTEKMRKGLENGNKFSDVDSSDYAIDNKLIEKVSGELQFSDEEKEDVLMLYQKIENRITNNEEYLNNFAETYANSELNAVSRRPYPFDLGIDELDPGFISIKSSGSRVLGRALGDTRDTEKNVTNEIQNFLNELRAVAINGEKDFSPLVKSLATIKNTLTSIQGLDYSQKVIYYLAKTAITYFKKDWYTEGLFGMPLSFIKKNSLAAEFAQRSEAVWSWEKPDIDKFITSLETAEILVKEPIDYQKTSPTIKTKFFGRIATKEGKIIFSGIPYKIREDFIYSARKLRKESGVSVEGKLAFILTRYTPIFLFLLLFLAVKNGFKELTGDKK